MPYPAAHQLGSPGINVNGICSGRAISLMLDASLAGRVQYPSVPVGERGEGWAARIRYDDAATATG